MKKSDGETSVQDHHHPHKPRRTRSREVSSRFLSSPGSTPLHDGGIQSPNQASCPSWRKPITQSSDSKRALRGSDDMDPPRGLWPSATTISVSSSSDNKSLDTLADHLGNDRLKDLLGRKNSDKNVPSNSSLLLNRQKSCSEVSRFESDSHRGITGSRSSILKENHRQILGGSMRYTGKFTFAGRKSTSSSAASNLSTFESPKSLLPGRLSVDENALYKSSSCRRSEAEPFPDLLDSEYESSEASSSCASNLSSASKKSGIEVSSRYMNNLTRRTKRDNLEAVNVPNLVLDHDSEKSKKFTIKGAIRRASSLTGYGSSRSQWAMSPGRTASPPMSVENKSRSPSFSSMKPPSSPSRPKGVERLLNMGLDLFKSKKTSPSNLSPLGSSSGGDHFHQLRLLHNRLMQWRLANARSDVASQTTTEQVERILLSAWESLGKLRHSVVQKKLQLERERLEIKLNCILRSLMKPLEDWGDMEWQHSSAISNTVESLHSIVSRIPLQYGAEADPMTTSYALRHASDLTLSIKSFLNGFTRSAESAVPLFSELAEVVAQEKLLLEECLEHLRIISQLEIKERNLACAILQLRSCQQLADSIN
ncbi:QWRF motif-containing protein 3-like [Punica granatum]|uniref:QWRF motif-containing protein 3-like n=1 Tax=Punica granatum TaxID=22663 RepID=A0A6P8D7K0_PUNGR|nr:QWRF motif-containing protein 3-like [Punica granatum]